MIYVTVRDSKITALFTIAHTAPDFELAANQKEISAEIAEQLIRLPAYFTQDDAGNILTVTPAPEPEPEVIPKSQLEILQETVDQLVLDSLGV